MATLALVTTLAAAPSGGRRKLPDPAPLFPVESHWAVTLDAPPSAGGAMDDAQIYVPTTEGTVLALDRDAGELVWSAPIATTWAPLPVGDLVIVASTDELVALRTASGHVAWRSPGPPLTAPPALVSGLVVLTSGNGDVRAVAARSGADAWQAALGAKAHHPPAVSPDGGVLVFALDDGHVVAIRGDSGRTLWRQPFQSALAAPAMAKDRVIVGGTDNVVRALHVVTGRELWRWRTGGDIIGAAADEGLVYVASLDNILRAVNRDNGNQRWKAVMPTRPAVPPVAFGGIVITSGVAPRIDGFISTTGVAQGSHRPDAELLGTPLIDRVMKPYAVALVTVTRDGRVTALRPEQMMMRDPKLAPLPELPGRRLDRDRLPLLRGL